MEFHYSVRSRVAWACLAALLAAFPGTSHAAAAAGEVTGLHRLTLNPGGNLVSLPLHGTAAYRGTVGSVAAASITPSTAPGWTAGAFGPQDGYAQYLVLVRTAGAASPAEPGDWWLVTGNAAGSVTVETRSQNLTTLLSAGDEIEIRRLTSVKDVFGSGASLRLIADSDFDVLSSQEDFIRLVAGTSFAGEIFYHDGTAGPAGYYADGDLVGTPDGSTLTFLPGQVLAVFRKTGAAPLEVLSMGSVLATPFTHYLNPGPNAVGVVFPIPTPIATSGLLESGWISDVNFDVLAAEDSFLRAVVGTSFGEEVFHYSGPDGSPAWYVNGDPSDTYAFQPTSAYMFFVKGPGEFRWRQHVPFVP